MINWILGVIAECSYYIARFHEGRCDRLMSRAKKAHDKAEAWSRRQQWADGVDGPFGPAPIIEGPAS